MFTLAGIVDKSGIDVILVGDSASNIMAGRKTLNHIGSNDLSCIFSN